MSGLRQSTWWGDNLHELLHHNDGRFDMRTPIVNETTGDVLWVLRPDLLNKGCAARGCRYPLYPNVRVVTPPPLGPGGEP